MLRLSKAHLTPVDSIHCGVESALRGPRDCARAAIRARVIATRRFRAFQTPPSPKGTRLGGRAEGSEASVRSSCTMLSICTVLAGLLLRVDHFRRGGASFEYDNYSFTGRGSSFAL